MENEKRARHARKVAVIGAAVAGLLGVAQAAGLLSAHVAQVLHGVAQAVVVAPSD